MIDPKNKKPRPAAEALGVISTDGLFLFAVVFLFFAAAAFFAFAAAVFLTFATFTFGFGSDLGTFAGALARFRATRLRRHRNFSRATRSFHGGCFTVAARSVIIHVVVSVKPSHAECRDDQESK